MLKPELELPPLPAVVDTRAPDEAVVVSGVGGICEPDAELEEAAPELEVPPGGEWKHAVATIGTARTAERSRFRIESHGPSVAPELRVLEARTLPFGTTFTSRR